MVRPCSSPGCPLVAEKNGRCKQHSRVYEKQRKVNSHAKMYTYKWREASIGWRKKHPLCVICEAEGKVVLGSCVDHIVDHDGDFQKFWDFSNVQTLCNACHSKKTWKEHH